MARGLMDELAREHLQGFYSTLLKLHGDRPEALRWSPEGQRLRYRAILEAAGKGSIAPGASVLDYGCGKADLYAYMLGLGIEVRYTGMDINPDLIALAGSKYPEVTLRVLDVEAEPLPEGAAYDYVFVCGVFNNRIQGATESMLNTARLLFNHTSRAMVLTALSAQTRQKQFDLNYVNPEELYDYAVRRITPRARMDTETMPEEIILTLTREGYDER